MTKEQKDLLLKDICGRLPYGVKVLYEKQIYKISEVSICNETITIYGERGYPIEVELQKIKPYLFPMSSMTEEQKKEYAHILVMSSNLACSQLMGETIQDWFHKNHFDYRGLIPMDLAIDATGLNI